MLENGFHDRTENEDRKAADQDLRLSFGDFELLEEIGRGGMGVVYKARQLSLNRIVAVKMILVGRLANPADRERFQAEAEVAAGLQHPNIVAIHEVGEHDGQPFFSMDYVEGQNLAELTSTQPLPAKRAASYLKTIAATVQYAHSKGVLHRDLKPSNILIDRNDQPRITDFGLAKRLDLGLSTPDPQLTLTGQVLGSPNFIPPEQAASERASMGAVSDIYSLGAVLYQLLTGRPPFMAETLAQILRLVTDTEPVAPRVLHPALPRDLETICLKCLQKERSRRYPTAQALADDLERFLSHQPIHARPVGAIERAWRWCRRYPALAGLAALVLALLVTVAVGSSLYAGRLREANRQSAERLREAYIGQAKAERWSGRPGRRFKGLDLLSKAAQIRPSVEIRSEAAACLALEDMRPTRAVELPPTRYLDFSSTYDRYVIADELGDVHIRFVSNDVEVARFPGAGKGSTHALFMADSRYLVVMGQAAPHLLLANDLQLSQRVLCLSNYPVSALDLNRDGRRFITASKTSPSELRSFTLPSGQMRVLGRVPITPRFLSLSPTGDRVAVQQGNPPREIEVRDAESGDVLFRLAQPTDIWRCDWHPDGGLLATCGADQNVHVWNVEAGTNWLLFAGDETGVSHVRFSRDGNYLVTSASDNMFRLWNLWSSRQVLNRPCFGENEGFSADGRWIGLTMGGTKEICEMALGREWRAGYSQQGTGSGAWQLAWSPNGQVIASAHRDGIRLWNASTCREICLVGVDSSEVHACQFAPDGSGLFAASARGSHVWPLEWSLTDSEVGLSLGKRSAFGPDSGSDSLFLDPQGNLTVIVQGGKVNVFDRRTQLLLRSFTMNDAATGCAVSPSGRLCIAWPFAANRPRMVWQVSSGTLLKTLPSISIFGAAFTPDDRLLVTGSFYDYQAWDTRSWSNIWTIPRQPSGGARGRVTFTPDGQLGALTISAQAIRIFDPGTGREITILEAPEPQTISWLAFSPDGGRLAATTQRSVIHLWDLRLIRQELAAMNLDWDGPPLPPPQAIPSCPITVSFRSATNNPSVRSVVLEKTPVQQSP